MWAPGRQEPGHLCFLRAQHCIWQVSGILKGLDSNELIGTQVQVCDTPAQADAQEWFSSKRSKIYIWPLEFSNNIRHARRGNLGLQVVRRFHLCVNHSLLFSTMYQNRVIESIFSLPCVLACEGVIAFGGCTIKKTRGRGGQFQRQELEIDFLIRAASFLSPERRPFSTLFLSVASLLGNSSSMETGTAVACQAFRHLLSGDEENIDGAGQRKGNREECRRQHCDGDGHLASGNVWLLEDGVASCASLLRIRLSKDLQLCSFTPVSCKDPSTRSTKQGALRIWKWRSTWKISGQFYNLFSSYIPPKVWNSAWIQPRIKSIWISLLVKFLKYLPLLYSFPQGGSDRHCKKSFADEGSKVQ